MSAGIVLLVLSQAFGASLAETIGAAVGTTLVTGLLWRPTGRRLMARVSDTPPPAPRSARESPSRTRWRAALVALPWLVGGVLTLVIVKTAVILSVVAVACAVRSLRDSALLRRWEREHGHRLLSEPPGLLRGGRREFFIEA